MTSGLGRMSAAGGRGEGEGGGGGGMGRMMVGDKKMVTAVVGEVAQEMGCGRKDGYWYDRLKSSGNQLEVPKMGLEI